MIGPLRCVPFTGLLLSISLATADLPARAPQQAQQAGDVKFATPTPPVPLFFREPWKQTGAFDASTGFRPRHPVTQAAVTSPSLALTVYDPGAGRIPELAKNPPANTNAVWRVTGSVNFRGGATAF